MSGTSDLISRKAVIDALDKRFDSVPMEQTTEILMLRKDLRELPSAEPDITTHDSIPAETGKNDGDGTSGDCISRTQAIDEIHGDADWLASQGSDWQVERMERDKSILMSLPSVQPDIIRCKDCKYYREYGYVNGKPKFLPRCTFSAIYVDADDFCSQAERREDG